MCGKAVERRVSKIVYVEGARLTLCPSCYSKVSRNLVAAESQPKGVQSSVKARSSSDSKAVRPRQVMSEEYEVVQDYATRIRSAREALGWSQKVLAEAVKEGENVIKRLESGRLVPSIELARRLEKVLNIKLLEPVAESLEHAVRAKDTSKYLTLGDVVNIKTRREGEGTK